MYTISPTKPIRMRAAYLPTMEAAHTGIPV